MMKNPICHVLRQFRGVFEKDIWSSSLRSARTTYEFGHYGSASAESILECHTFEEWFVLSDMLP